MATGDVSLNPNVRSAGTIEFQNALRANIVGQDDGVQALVELFQVFTAGLNSPGRPVGNLLFLGPTGSGKTRIVEAAAEILFGSSRAVIKIDCAEFQHSHEIAKIIGSPPGYLGHRETHPLITQEALAANHTEKLKLSFLLFDEIEKASDALWQLLLGMLDKATLTLGDNRRVDLSQTVIFMTSNLGAHEITDLMAGGYGFIKSNDKPQTDMDQKVERTAVEAARRKFSPEFMNRLDKLVVFRQLKRPELEAVLDIELGLVQKRVLDTATSKFLFRVTDPGREFLLREGTDQRYGARHLKRAIERYLVYPLANLLATQQVNLGDLVRVDWDGVHNELTFVREQEGAIVAQEAGEETLASAAAPLQDGLAKDAPAEAVADEAAARPALPAASPAVARQSLQGRKKEHR
ncbi:MAG TPA: AAA family ATPase [Candidatus Eisenbacteria bacterium]|nr:AAA family ATPase [Candidatus Eisenbacteria bacterium]